jgi:hypothetical protein
MELIIRVMRRPRSVVLQPFNVLFFKGVKNAIDVSP